MKNRLLYTCISSLFIFILSCERAEQLQDNDSGYLNSEGFFIVNEGNYNWGNGSLSYYSYDSAAIYNNIYEQKNGVPLGDVAQSIALIDNKVFIIVNNSGKIEVANKVSLDHIATIDGLISPRDMCRIDNSKAYVSSLYSDSICIIDTDDFTILNYLDIEMSSESMIKLENMMFIANWSFGNTITVVDLTEGTVLKRLVVADEPQSMVLDKSNNLWVLCSGGYMNSSSPELIMIDTRNLLIDRRIAFDTGSYPTELCINGSGDKLFYLNNDVYSTDVDDIDLPHSILIDRSDRNFYSMDFDLTKSQLIITDALDYQQNGFLYIFEEDGTELNKVKAGIIPGSIAYEVE